MATTDLTVSMSDFFATTAVPGTSVTYTMSVTNNGPDPVNSLTLTDAIPAALLNATFGSPTAGRYDPSTGLWSGLSLATGHIPEFITLTGTIDPNASGTITNTVTVAPPLGTTDTDLTNNTATDTDTLTPEADLAVTVTDGTTSIAPGANDTYTITVTNNGPSTAAGAAVTDWRTSPTSAGRPRPRAGRAWPRPTAPATSPPR